MPLTIPAFSQYNAPMPPLRGLWHAAPAEGDFFVSAEIDWQISPPASAVQFSLSGNSPVALSQIVALVVDNGRSGADVSFVFPDTGFELVVAARNQGVFPVFTNALMFYAVGTSTIAGDVTIIQIMNSMPPPIPIVASSAQNHVSLNEANLNNGTTPLIASPISGTLNTLSIVVYVETVTASALAQLQLVDGTGKALWTQVVAASSTPQNLTFNLPGLTLRFSQGVNLVISESTLSGGVTVNAYYSTP
jgi:hypothetical protein